MRAWKPAVVSFGLALACGGLADGGLDAVGEAARDLPAPGVGAPGGAEAPVAAGVEVAWEGPAAPAGDLPNLASFAMGARPRSAQHAHETILETGALLDDWLPSHWGNHAEYEGPVSAVFELGARSRVRTLELAIHGDLHYLGLENAPARVDVSLGDGIDGPWRAAWTWTPTRAFDVGSHALPTPTEASFVKVDVQRRAGSDFGVYLSHLGVRGEPVGAPTSGDDPVGRHHGGWLLGAFEIYRDGTALRGCFVDTGKPIDVSVDGRTISLRWREDDKRGTAIIVPIAPLLSTGTIQTFGADGTPNDVALLSVERYPGVEPECGPTGARAIPPAPANTLESQLEASGRVQVYNLLFDFGSDRLRAESAPILDEIAAALRAHPDWKLLVEGHTDSVGSGPSNLDLSRRRAAAAVAGLVERGIAPQRLRSDGFGASRPVATNDTPNGRAENRRVDLVRE
jgi:outer membrane protein OmpA-like peptidoglycan-associated protein